MMDAHKVLKKHPKHPVVRPEGLPDDAAVGHNADVVKLLQAYLDQNNPDKQQVAGYATSANPSADGDYVGDGVKQIMFYWYKGDPDTIVMCSADYAFARLRAGKTTWVD